MQVLLVRLFFVPFRCSMTQIFWCVIFYSLYFLLLLLLTITKTYKMKKVISILFLLLSVILCSCGDDFDADTGDKENNQENNQGGGGQDGSGQGGSQGGGQDDGQDDDKDDATVISSIVELAEAAAQSGGNIRMTPGVYQMSDYATPEVIANTPILDSRGIKVMMLFSGSDNVFDLTGVTIEVDTKLLAAYRASINEIQITGDNVLFKGLTVTDVGNNAPTGKGARSFVVAGDNVTVDGVTLNMSGSSPYGYGDLLGKGGGSVVSLAKHSGMLIEGLDSKILNCKIYSKSFGHLFFVQGGRNTLFENCYAEGVMRSTDEMLSETSGPAYNVGFESAYSNRFGTKKIVPGYVKSLNECGFRTYGAGGAEALPTGKVTVRNCHAKNTRIGFAFTRVNEDMLLENCTAEGCEVGYSLEGVDVKSSRGDAENGPLLNITKTTVPSNVELELMPAESKYTVHCLTAIVGDGHTVKLTRYNEQWRDGDLPIMLGTSRPGGNNGYSPLGKGATSGVTLENSTGMTVELNELTKNCNVKSITTVTNKGAGNTVIIDASLL